MNGNTKPINPMEFSRRLLIEMFDDNVRLSGKMLEIGDTASARRMLHSALMQIDQLEMLQPKAKPQPQPQALIEV